MALHNPAGLFQGAAPLNPLPYVNIALAARARKQAREDAIDKHFQDLPNTINDKNVRDAEIEGLNNMKADIYAYGQKYKEALRKGDGAALQGLQKKFRDAATYAQESKNRTATAVKLSQLRGNPKYDYIFRDPQLIEKIAKHEAAVGTPGSEAINFDQLTLPPPPFDPVKHNAGLKLKAQDDVDNILYKDIPGDKLNRKEITPKKYSDDDLNTLHIYAQSQLENNPSFAEQIKNKVQGNPELAANLSKLFETNYKHPILTEGDLATAYTMALRDDLTPTEKTVLNRTAIMDKQNAEWDRRRKEIEAFGIKMEKIKDGHIRARQKDGSYYQIDNVPDKLKNDTKSLQTPYGAVDAVDITEYPSSYKDDILGDKKDKYGERINKPIVMNGREYVTVKPDGNYAGDNGYIVNPKDIYIRTNNRTVKLEKPIGTGKAEIRDGKTETVAEKMRRLAGNKK